VSEDAIAIERVKKSYGPHRGVEDDAARSTRTRLRVPRPERRGEDDNHPLGPGSVRNLDGDVRMARDKPPVPLIDGFSVVLVELKGFEEPEHDRPRCRQSPILRSFPRFCPDSR
jgi:hypothetical protein